jgi:3-oxoacyl-[acyl-carrier protein] reductase
MGLQLEGRHALVTGACVGIGRGIALALAAEGVKLSLTARGTDKLQELADEALREGGPTPALITKDIYAEGAALQIVSAAQAGHGPVVILVNNAGGLRSFKDLQ